MSTDAGGSWSVGRGRARIEAHTRRDGSRSAQDRWVRFGSGREAAADAVKPLRDLAAERTRLEGRIRVSVQELRLRGASWTVVGDALGVTRSAAQKRYGADELPLS